ncbi:uncharacterized protein LOC134277804 isoform X1 [Saccostrea cucullata]|uniref:uncharacterized protein LOC134277804 isoform X1 n=1 Tax=Saccostrea cuccullata TaxID=36930 RepID=UPI002ED28DE7
MSTEEERYFSGESYGDSVGERIQRRAYREQYGSAGPGSRDVGVQMKTHYILEPNRYFSKVRDVGTQTRENVNKVIYNPRILSSSYTEKVRQKRSEKDFSFVYNHQKHELFRIRKRKTSDLDNKSETSTSDRYSTASSYESTETYGDDSERFSFDIEEYYDESRETRTVAVQMSTKYLVQESRPKAIVRDVAIQTKLPPLYAPSGSEMIERLWNSRLPLSKNVTCSLPPYLGQENEISGSTSYRSLKRMEKVVPEFNRIQKVNERLRQKDNAKYYDTASDGNVLYWFNNREGKTSSKDWNKQRDSGDKELKRKKLQNEREKSKGSYGGRCKSYSSRSMSSRSSDCRNQKEENNRNREETFELASFEYLGGEQSSFRVKSEMSSIGIQTEREDKSSKLFRKPKTKPESEWTSDLQPATNDTRKLCSRNSETSLEILYPSPCLTKEKEYVYARKRNPAPLEIIKSSNFPYKPEDEVIYTESKSQTENSPRNTRTREDSVHCLEIGSEPDVIPAEFVEKPVIKPRVRKPKPPPPPDVVIRVGGGWMKEEHHRIQHRPLHRKFQPTADRIPFVRSQFHYSASKTPVVNRERKQTDKIRYASFIP